MAKLSFSAVGTPKSDRLQTSPTVVYMEPEQPWQQELARSNWTAAALSERLSLSRQWVKTVEESTRKFPIRATESYLQRIRPDDPNDPLLQQILPTPQELQVVAGYCKDPVGDHAAMQPGGLLQKYQGRALLITTAACAIHCRYCFRRDFPYQQHHFEFNQREALHHLQSDTTLQEVILSGGDPLVLSDKRLSQLLDQLETIPHLRTIRLHSRIPVVLPSRITQTLVNRLQQSRLTVVLVIHSNHPNELDRSVAEAMQSLKQADITLLNQSVLLKGVNNQLETLYQLSHTLFEIGVLPYYLHLLDRVSGSHHFDLPEGEATALYQQLRAQLPGYLLPRLVREIEGEASKTTILS